MASSNIVLLSRMRNHKYVIARSSDMRPWYFCAGVHYTSCAFAAIRHGLLMYRKSDISSAATNDYSIEDVYFSLGRYRSWNQDATLSIMPRHHIDAAHFLGFCVTYFTLRVPQLTA